MQTDMILVRSAAAYYTTIHSPYLTNDPLITSEKLFIAKINVTPTRYWCCLVTLCNVAIKQTKE